MESYHVNLIGALMVTELEREKGKRRNRTNRLRLP